MIFLLSMITVWAGLSAKAEDPGSCADQKPAKFVAVELKLNLDGNSKPDVVAVYSNNVSGGATACERRAVIFDAPAKLDGVVSTEWLGTMDYADPELKLNRQEIEKRTVADRDLLFVSEEVGDFSSYTFYSADKGKLKKMMSHAHPNADGQFTEVYDKKRRKLGVKIFDGGSLEVNGTAVDLDQRAIKLRCRVRELFLNLKYEWDAKNQNFRLVEEGCVMGPAID